MGMCKLDALEAAAIGLNHSKCIAVTRGKAFANFRHAAGEGKNKAAHSFKVAFNFNAVAVDNQELGVQMLFKVF